MGQLLCGATCRSSLEFNDPHAAGGHFALDRAAHAAGGRRPCRRRPRQQWRGIRSRRPGSTRPPNPARRGPSNPRSSSCRAAPWASSSPGRRRDARPQSRSSLRRPRAGRPGQARRARGRRGISCGSLSSARTETATAAHYTGRLPAPATRGAVPSWSFCPASPASGRCLLPRGCLRLEFRSWEISIKYRRRDHLPAGTAQFRPGHANPL